MYLNILFIEFRKLPGIELNFDADFVKKSSFFIGYQIFDLGNLFKKQKNTKNYEDAFLDIFMHNYCRWRKFWSFIEKF